MKAVCVRCGMEKDHYAHVCPACGNRPDGDGMLVAWLASTEHVDAAVLPKIAAQIQAGHPFRPSSSKLREAQRALGRVISTDAGLTVAQRLGILLCSLVFTPLVGWTCFFWWRTERPRAAWQALGLSLPFTVLFTGIWGYAIFYGVT